MAAGDDMTGSQWAEPNGPIASTSDLTEAQKMDQFNQDPSQPWWQSALQYGFVRAIDNRFGPTNVAGNTNPGSFAGQNGATYQQGATPTPAGGIAGMFGGGTLLLIVGGLALVYALSR